MGRAGAKAGREGEVRVRDVIRLLESNGWVLVRQKGSHKSFRHPDNPSVITVPDHPGDLKPGTLRDILKKAGLQ